MKKRQRSSKTIETHNNHFQTNTVEHETNMQENQTQLQEMDHENNGQ